MENRSYLLLFFVSLPGIYLKGVSSFSSFVNFAFYVEQKSRDFFEFFEWFHQVFISCEFGFE